MAETAISDKINNIFKTLCQSEIILAAVIMCILTLLFVPMPATIMDVLFAISITTAVVILLTVMFVEKSMEFSAFPMLLLMTTMLRLALNVASTRLILSDGHSTTAAAGKIIETFGNVVMGGQFIIGLIIFLILVIVNFVVITKGSTRIAEVAARFTLDSLPGKQMAIDADLNAGLISEDEARERRSSLEQETGFFGAMDGASKFVRGDAIAGLIITGLNICVGIGVGVATYDMSFGEAADRYMLLTIGDGLVAQIPALIISLAAGILVAKSGTTKAAGAVVFDQIGSNYKALFAAAGLLFIISMMPNMPILPFWSLAFLLSIAGYSAMGGKLPFMPEDTTIEEVSEEDTQPQEEPISSILHIDTLRLELGYGLLGLIDEAKGGKLTEQIKAMRRQMAKEIGFVTPSIRIQDNMQIDPGTYTIYIKDIEAGTGTLRPGKFLAMDPTGAAPKMEGEETTEPTFNLPALWVDESKKEEASFNGYTIVDCSTVITTHMTEIIKENMAELLTRKECEKLLDEIREDHGKMIDDLVPAVLSMGVVQKVLQNLLSERISIRDLPTILEALSDAAVSTKNVSTLTEIVRSSLARQICTTFNNLEGILPVVSLSGGWEKEFTAAIHTTGDNHQLVMEPTKVQNFVKSTKDIFEKHMMSGEQPVLLTSPGNRQYVRSILERSLPMISVISQAEVYPKARIRTLGTV